jgi:hypothetical protein
MVRRALALFATLLVVAASTTTPAAAGGPTSVLLSAPPHVVAFGYEDSQYSKLQTLTQVVEGREPGNQSHDSGPSVRATWLIHDTSVWRVDTIYPDAPGGPWIATVEGMDGSLDFDKPVWHTATDSLALVRLLSESKLLPGVRNGEQAPVASATPEPQVIESSVFTGWRWLLPGVLVGAVLAWAASRFLRQRRWDLIDAD